MKRTFSPTLCVVATLLLTHAAFADSINWLGGGDQNWSTGANWTNATAATSGTAPGSADAVSFFDSAFSSSTVDGGFSGTISSLRGGATNTDHVVTITAGQTLNITGAGGLRMGTPGDTGLGTARTLTFTGNGAALNLNNTSASLVLNQGTATNINGSRATLDLQNLDTFTANLTGIGLGTTHYANTVPQRNSGTLYLAKSNFITLTYSAPLSVYTSNGAATNAIELVNAGSGNNPGVPNAIYLGITNAIFVDSIGIGRSKSSTAAAATLTFNPAIIGFSPVAYFRGIGGVNSRVTWWGIGDMADNASSAQHAVGTNNFTGGTVDAMVETMSLGRDCSPSHTATGGGRVNIGVLTFDSGTINVNTLIVGNQSLGPNTSTTPNLGVVNVTSGNASLTVNSNLILANTTHSGVSAVATIGILNVTNGTVRANNIIAGASASNHVINLYNNATLVLSNTLGATKPIRTLSASDSTLVLHLTGAPIIASVTNLVTGGSGNTISIGSAITFSSYPAQVALFKYSSLSGSGNNFTLGSLPGNVVGASLSNNTFNSSIDLYIPFDPRPVITNQPDGFSGGPGANVNFLVQADGVPPFTYQWRRDGTNFSNGGNVSGVTTDTLSFTSAQPANNSSYTVVISNAYGSTTSAPPAVLSIGSGNQAPTLTGPNNQSVIQGNDTVLSASFTGVPTPALQWYKNGSVLSGETGNTLSIFNAQYPANEAVYSLVATNVAGKVTNSATLTVMVPPGIVNPPVSAVVAQGSPASFTIVASGHPAPTYQWSKNNNNILNATNATLPFGAALPGDAGNYAVLISNGGGSTNSDTVTLTVTSTTLTYTNLSPANGATGVGYDTPLYLKFNTTPVLGTSGLLRIYDAANNLADTIDLSQNAGSSGQTRTIAGGTYYTYPVIIRSNTAAVFPHLGVMTSNTTYYVLMDNGFFMDSGGASMTGISNTTAWRFTTKLTGPDPATVSNVVVAANGSGDFVTVQGAIDWVPAGNTTPINILVRKGTYEEINRIPTGKNNLTFIGEGCGESVITYANNNTFQLANASTSTRVMFYAGGNDTVFKNLTFTNSTPQGGSQAEAVRVQGLRIILDNCTLCSYQDTLLINTANTSSAFVNKCLIQGDVDFIWGSGIGFFQSCEIRALLRPASGQGINTQGRASSGAYGLIFVDCFLTRNSLAVTNWSLGREATTFPEGNVAYLNCRMDSHIIPAGWTDGGLADKSTLRFWEYQSKDLTGTTLLATNSRVPWSRQLDASEYDTVRNPTNVFATIAWTPSLAPYVACQPDGQSVLAGDTVTISAEIGGIPEPVYQWYKGATPVSGGTNFNLVIANVQAANAGTYSLRVTNDLGYVISSNAVLTVTVPAPPSFSNPTRLANGNVQFTYNGTSGQAYRVWANTNLALRPVTSTWDLLTNGTFTGSSISFTDTLATNYVRRFYIITVP